MLPCFVQVCVCLIEGCVSISISIFFQLSVCFDAIFMYLFTSDSNLLSLLIIILPFYYMLLNIYILSHLFVFLIQGI